MWRYVAENVAKVECMPAPDHLLPDNDRREHKNTPVKLVSVLKPSKSDAHAITGSF